ncbi:MAG TPA: hypothetical protein GX743_02995 [Actinomycetales bacterium]|nr:hypothetical protein [Actinomycetales bacterium]
MTRLKNALAVGALALALVGMPVTAQAQPEATGLQEARTAPTSKCTPNGSQTDCTVGGGAREGDSGSRNASGRSRLGFSWVGICGGAWDVNGDGQVRGSVDFPKAIDWNIGGYPITESGCQITLPDGSTGTWVPYWNAWIVNRMAEQAPPPTWCVGYNERGSWYWGVVANTRDPQPIWAGPESDEGEGTCPTPTMNPRMVASRLVEAYITESLRTGDLAMTPPEDGESPAAVGLPVRFLLADPVEGETVSMTSPTVLSEQGIEVSILAELENVEFDLGDGTVLTCDYNPETGNIGIPFEEGEDPRTFESGCQHAYTSLSADQPDGKFPISAVANWRVEWSVAADENLSDVEFPETPEVTGQIQVGEVQTQRR